MRKDNKMLLQEVINDRLNRSLSDDSEEAKVAFNEAMEAIDRQQTLDKDKKDAIIKAVEIGAAVLLAPLVEAGCKKAFAHMLCEFEKDYNFTTMAGKSLSGLFKFRK